MDKDPVDLVDIVSSFSIMDRDTRSKRVRGMTLLGIGQFSRVYEAILEDRREGRKKTMTVAWKVIVKSDETGERSYRREVEALVRLNVEKYAWAPRLISYTPEEGHLTMSYIRHPSLAAHLKIVKQLTLPSGWALFCQLFCALDTLHGLGMAHHDIKPGNIIYWPVTGNITLVDFGFAQFISHRDEARFEVCCTPFYAPTEAMNATNVPHILTHADWYGMAMCVYEVTQGGVPVGEKVVFTEQLIQWRNENPEFQLHVKLPNKFGKLLVSMLHNDPLKRPSVEVIRRAIEGKPRTRTKDSKSHESS